MFSSISIRTLLLAGFVVFSTTLQSCSDSTPTDNNGTTTEPTIKPAVGSTYTFSTQRTDEDRVAVGAPIVETYTVADSSVAALNSSGYLFLHTPLDAKLVRYESNGDLSLFFAEEEIDDVPEKWVTIPFGSRISRTDTLIVDQSYGPMGIPLNVRATSTIQEDTTITVDGQSLKIQRVEWKVTHDYGSSREYYTYTLWYAPKLGFFVKWDYLDSGSFFGTSGGGSVKTLTAFTLK